MCTCVFMCVCETDRQPADRGTLSHSAVGSSAPDFPDSKCQVDEQFGESEMEIKSKPITRIIIIKFLLPRAMCPLPCQYPLDPHSIFAEEGTWAVGVDDPAVFLCNHMQYVLITASLWPRGHFLVCQRLEIQT